MTKLSVIIPVYNVEAYLAKCVESVLAQDFADYELLLVDDGSTDNSGSMCDEYAAAHAHIQVIHQQNKGLGGARNTGIEAACGDYLLFVDSDDFIKEGMFSYLYQTAVENNSDVVSFGMDYVDAKGNVLESRRAFDNGTCNLHLEENPALFSLDPYAWNKIYKRALFLKNDIRFPERMWYEDLCVTPKLLLCADTITLTDRVFYQYLQRDDSIMHVKNADRNSDMLEVVSSILDFYKEKGAFQKYQDALCFMTVMHVLVLCTLRVAAIDAHHALLKQFYAFTQENFPDFKTNSYVQEHLTFRHKIIFAFSKRRLYAGLQLLDRLNRLR